MQTAVAKEKSWLMQVAENANERDINESNFFSKVDIDISHNNKRMSPDGSLIMRIATYLDYGLDFGLKNEAGGYVFFIRKQWMVTYNPTDHNQNAVFDLADTKEFENRLKVAVLFHPELVMPAMIKLNPTYDYLTRSLLI